MENEDLLNEAREFLEENKSYLSNYIKQSKSALEIDFERLLESSPNIANMLIDKPEETIQILELAVAETSWIGEKKIRFLTLPSTQSIKIRNLRAKNLGKMISVEGVIRQASEVRPQVTNAKFECPSCGTIISVLQIDKEKREPSKCSCGRKGSFKEISKDMIDSQIIVLEESPDSLDIRGDQPKRIKALLYEDLTDPKMERRVIPGNKVKLIGILNEVEISGSKKPLVRYDIAIKVNNLVPLEDDIDDVEISEEDEKHIKEISKRPDLFNYLSRSVAPSIWGHEEVKKALTLQLFGGVRRKRTDGSYCREQIHGLLVGDPGVAKSVILKYLTSLAHKARYVSGKSASGVGLTASASRDEMTKSWVLEAGAMVLANNGSLFIDEFEKMTEEDRSNLHEGMSMGTISVAKANIQACYSEDTEVLTENGWKHYLDVGDSSIAQYNLLDNSIKFLPHKGLYEYNYNGKMFHFKNKRNDILVTPNHKMLICPSHKKKFIPIIAENIGSKRFKVKNSAEYHHKATVENIIIKAINHKQKRTKEKYTNQYIDKVIPVDLWLEFLGYYLSEGGLNKTNNTMAISQNKGWKADKIESCLEKMSNILGCKLTKIDCGKFWRFNLTTKQLADHLLQYGIYSYNKTLGGKVSDFSKRQLEILFDALMLGDGCSKGKYYSTTSEKLGNEFQEIALLLGKSAKMKISLDKRGNRRLQYRVILSNRCEPTLKKDYIKKTDYNGKVWCFSTETGFFITRRNGYIAIQGNTLSARTSILAAANPKMGRFDNDRPIAEQINLIPSLLSRFDFIFVMRDIPEEQRDLLIADKIFDEHDDQNQEEVLEKEMFRKYIAYSRGIKPNILKDASDRLKEYYVGLRKRAKNIEGKRVIPIGARQLEGLIRFSEASAKLHLRKEVIRDDAELAIQIMESYLKEVGYDEENKTFDIDKITGNSTSQRGKIETLFHILKKMEMDNGKIIQIEEVKKRLEDKFTEKELEEAINKIVRNGDAFRPMRGTIQLL